MKIYAEEQVRKAIYKARALSDWWDIEYQFETNDIIDSLTHIELPSDEEMEKELLEHTKVSTIDPYKSFYFNAAMFGAKWVIEQIKQQDNG